MKQRHFVAVMQAALAYEEAWDIYSNPFSNEASKGMTEVDRILTKARAHQALLDAVREAKEA